MRSVFVVHSQRNPWHLALYEAVVHWGAGSVVVYDDWMWTTPKGCTTSEAIQRFRDHVSGVYDVDGIGKVRVSPGQRLDAIHLLPGGLNKPYPKRLNRDDLGRLIEQSRVVLLVEDDDGDRLTSGMAEELQILRNSRTRKINVRITSALDRIKEQSIFEFPVIADDHTLAARESSGDNFHNRLTVWLLKSSPGQFEPESLSVVLMATAIGVEDNSGGGSWGTAFDDRGRFLRLAPIRLTAVPVLFGWRKYIADTFASLIVSESFYTRRQASIALLSSNDPSLVWCAAQTAAKTMAIETDREKIEDFATLMAETASLDWGAVIEAIWSNAGVRVRLE